MKEFDLEKAKAGVPVCTRDGSKARIIFWDAKDDKYKIIALITCSDGCESPESYTTNGQYLEGHNSRSDLMMVEDAPTKHEGWVNIYSTCSNKHVGFAGNIYNSKEDALSNDNTHDKAVATVKIEWEE